jgi:hypothetical protein
MIPLLRKRRFGWFFMAMVNWQNISSGNFKLSTLLLDFSSLLKELTTPIKKDSGGELGPTG